VRAVKPGLRRPPQGHARGHCHSHRWKAITEDLGIKLENVKSKNWQSQEVTIDKDNTTIVAGAGKSSEIEGRIKQLRLQVEETTSDYDKEKLQERLAKLLAASR